MGKYIIDETTLTSIADSLRDRTGIAGDIEPEQMVIDIASLSPATHSYSDYVETEALRVANLAKAAMNDNTISFIALADTHVLTTNATTMAGLNSAMNGARIIKETIPVDFTAVLGDVSAGTSSDTREAHQINLLESRRAMGILSPDVVIEGNHDRGYNADAWLSGDLLYRYVGRFNKNVTRPSSNADRGYCYMDLTDKKTRVIFMNTSDLRDKTSDSHGACYISPDQYSWLVSTLTDVGAKSGWNILLLTHHPLHWDATIGKVVNVLDAYNLGTSGSVTIDGATVSYNFSGKNLAKLICNIHGHTHNFITGTVGETEIVRIGTPNAYFYRNNEYGSSSYSEDIRSKFGDTTTYNKTANSAKDTSFCIYVIDTSEKTVNAFCYGAGFDRALAYEGIYYSVTYNLTGATANNTPALVSEGESYTTTITPTGSNKIRSSSVTMGGSDVTPSSSSEGHLSVYIPSVSGDIVINVYATAYINKVLSSIDSSGTIYNGTGYKWGYRLNSSGAETAMTQDAEGGTCSGFIPYNDEIIRICGSWSNNLSHTGWYIQCYNSSFAHIGGLAGSGISTMSTIEQHATIKTYDGKTSYIWTVNPANITNTTLKGYLTNAAYIRISAPRCYGSDLVCTLDEEIIE